MAFNGVPWFIGGGQAEHTPDVARFLAWYSTKGEQGVASATSMKVSATSTPGSTVRVAPGGAAVLNRAPDGLQQSYLINAPTETSVAITATGSSGGRTDLIVAQIRDPYVAGTTFQVPTTPATGPYCSPVVLPNTTSVPSGMSAIALAKIVIPASTSTITNAMITDMRVLANARQVVVPRSAALNDEVLSGGSFHTWPTQFQPSIPIPAWANHFDATMTLFGAATTSASVDGAIRLRFANQTGGPSIIDINVPAGGSRHTLVASVGGFLTDYIGGNANIVLEGLISGGALGVNSGAQASVSVVFDEVLV